MKSVSKIPQGYFMHLPQRVKTKMLRNIVEVGQYTSTGSTKFIGDLIDHSPLLEWCELNCSGMFYTDGSSFFFESPVDKALFLTARPYGSDYK